MAWEGKDDVGGLVRMREIQGKGRGVVAAQPLKAGQIVLTDSPILLYSAFPFEEEEEEAAAANNYCSNCFRLISIQQSTTTTTTSVIVGCPGCSCDFFFCSPKCQSIGTSSSSSSHTPWVCQSLCRLRPLLQHHPLDLQLQARFLIAAYNLSPSHFQTLLSLQGSSSSSSVDDPNNNNNNSLFLHSLISSHSPPPPHLSAAAVEFCPQLTAALLAKDKLNAFGLMEPFSEEKFGYRSVRAYGIYPRASFFNHDCLPNACRFDYLDHQSSTSTPDLIIRMIHDVPQGREICLSYFPVNLNYSDRQRRLRDDYGFTCDCDRCKVEANWSDHEPMDDDDDEEEEDCHQDMLGEMDSETESSGRGGLVKEDNNNDDDDDDDFPHAYFFLRYMCNRNNCWGTLAPLPPTPTPTPDHHSPTPSTVLECNVCGNFHVTPEE